METWDPGAFTPGIIAGKKFLLYHIAGADPTRSIGSEGFVMTATVMVRTKTFRSAQSEFKEVFSWRLWLGDKTILFSIASLADVYFLADEVAVYRRTSSGMMSTQGTRVCLDSSLLRIYFLLVVFRLGPYVLPEFVLSQYIGNARTNFHRSNYAKLKYLIKCIFGVFLTRFRPLMLRRSFFLYWCALNVILSEKLMVGCFLWLVPRIPYHIPRQVKRLYDTYV